MTAKRKAKNKRDQCPGIKKWPRGVVPYVIDKRSFNEGQISLIQNSMKIFHKKTCVRFRPARPRDKHFINITGAGAGCWSYVGNQRVPGQIVNFQTPVCMHYGIIIHELMHVLGFYHQHSVNNRDQYVKIEWDNIRQEHWKNFQKHERATNFGLPYDYNSIMHYSEMAFSKNNKRTIVPKKPNVDIGQRGDLSDRDIKKINILYGCKKKCSRR